MNHPLLTAALALSERKPSYLLILDDVQHPGAPFLLHCLDAHLTSSISLSSSHVGLWIATAETEAHYSAVCKKVVCFFFVMN